jgi:hypothetical protein
MTDNDFKTWPINKHVTMIDDGEALTFDLGQHALSLLPTDVPKVMAACAEWLADRQ